MQKSHTKVFDPHRYRVLFPDRWSQFVRAHHRNAEEVAFVYGVTFQTACNWWHGTNRPSGDKVALAAMAYPDSFADIFGQAA